MSRVRTFSKEISSANILVVTVGTNCPQGGDSGHGGRTVLRLKNLGGTDMSVRVDDGQLRAVESLEIVLGGDAECDTFTEALEYAVSVLRAQTQLTGSASKDEEIE